jgi:predicted Zn-dependent protease
VDSRRYHRLQLDHDGASSRLGTTAKDSLLLPHDALELVATRWQRVLDAALAPWARHLESWVLIVESRVVRKWVGSRELRTTLVGVLVKCVVEGPSSRAPVVWQMAARGADLDALDAGLARALASRRLAEEIHAVVEGRPLAVSERCAVVLDPWVASTLIHECIGHSSEADNYLDEMVPAGLELGHRWTGLPLQVVDNPGLAGHLGSYELDDEGSTPARTELVRDGLWNDLLHSRETAERIGRERSGNGRRNPGAPRTFPRMSVTYVAPGADTPDALVARVEQGVYCVGAIGGRSSGRDFIVRPAYGIRIRDGRLTGERVRRFDLVGDKVTTMAQLCGIADDLTFVDHAFGGCDKGGQNDLSMTQGAPHLALSVATLRPIASATS